MAITHLVYLHGFRSSPQSTKARRMAAWVQQQRPDLHWWCPQLPPSPKQAIALVDEGVVDWPRERVAVIGSSLGGFYATVLAERIGCKAVLLNPAVEPARDLAPYVGDMTAWHSGDPFVFEAGHVDELRAMKPREITRPERYFAIIAKGDELLDWREMTARYVACRMKLLDRGDHALSDFDAHLSDVLRFLGLEPPLAGLISG